MLLDNITEENQGEIEEIILEQDNEIEAVRKAILSTQKVKKLNLNIKIRRRNMAISIALTKGRLEENAVMLMEKAGFGIEELKNKGRKLIFNDSKEDIRYF